MNPIVIIPARGGSKGIPGKNIKELGGKPLIEHTIIEARKIFNDEDIIVSTDDREIKRIVEETGLKVPFLRPKKFATDEASTRDVILNVLDFFVDGRSNIDVVVLLQPTSPFRRSSHIQDALEIYKRNPMTDMIVSVKETSVNPYFLLFEEDNQGFLVKSKNGNFTRRQDCPKVWEYNGAIYIINVSSIKKEEISEFQKVKKFVMDKLSSIDIDDEVDWMVAEHFESLLNHG